MHICTYKCIRGADEYTTPRSVSATTLQELQEGVRKAYSFPPQGYIIEDLADGIKATSRQTGEVHIFTDLRSFNPR